MLAKNLCFALLIMGVGGFVHPVVAQATDDGSTVFSGRVPTVGELIQALSPKGTERTKTRSLDLSQLSAEEQLQITQYGDPPKAIGLDLPPETLEVNLSKASLDAIEFEFDSDQIKAEAWPVLMRVAQAIGSPELEGQKFTIEGHTDAKGSDEYNLDLSKRRAGSVRLALITQFRIPASRLYAIGQGKKKLLNPAHPFSGENRRVVFVAF